MVPTRACGAGEAFSGQQEFASCNGKRSSVLGPANASVPSTLDRRTIAGGFKVVDASGQSLAYFYARENDNDAGTAGVLTMDEARRLASNFAKLPELLTRG